MIVREILPGIAAVKLQLSGLQGCAEVMVHGLAPTCRRPRCQRSVACGRLSEGFLAVYLVSPAAGLRESLCRTCSYPVASQQAKTLETNPMVGGDRFRGH